MKKLLNMLPAIAVSALIIFMMFNEMDFNPFEAAWKICTILLAVGIGLEVYLSLESIEEKTKNAERLNKTRRILYGKKNQID